MYHAYIYYNAGNSTAAYRVIKHRHRVDKYLRHLYSNNNIKHHRFWKCRKRRSSVRRKRIIITTILRSVRDPFIGISACRGTYAYVRYVVKKQRSRNRCAGVSLYRAIDRSAWITTGRLKWPVACGGGRCAHTLSGFRFF